VKGHQLAAPQPGIGRDARGLGVLYVFASAGSDLILVKGGTRWISVSAISEGTSQRLDLLG